MRNRLFLLIILLSICVITPARERTRLLVRSDDIGSSHAANVSCIRVATEGISRSLEVMVCCPWFIEAAKMLQEHPQIDVGVHITLTSEWDNYKWGPITGGRTLVDQHGHFVATTREWANMVVDMGELEAELRAQIELALKMLPSVSHITNHMGAGSVRPAYDSLLVKLAHEYGLGYKYENLRRTPDTGWNKATTLKAKRAAFISMLEQLVPGDWLFVEHPGNLSPEMQAHSIGGKHHIAWQRNAVTHVFTHPKIARKIKKLQIELISYVD